MSLPLIGVISWGSLLLGFLLGWLILPAISARIGNK